MSSEITNRTGSPDEGLPEFERPPLAEVVLGIQFDPLVRLRAVHLGSVWSTFSSRFPRSEDSEPLQPTFERFESPLESQSLRWILDLGPRPPLPRVQFMNEGGDELLQFQRDRFVHNWRRVNAALTYPRYPSLRESFKSEAETLEHLISERVLGEFKINQCEVTYINHIISDEQWSHHCEAGRLFPMLAAMDSVKTDPPPEHVRFESAFVMSRPGTRPCGRLHVSIVAGFLKEGAKPMFGMALTARGEPLGDGIDGAMRFLDLGHRWIVTKFTELTSEAMHVAWGKKAR